MRHRLRFLVRAEGAGEPAEGVGGEVAGELAKQGRGRSKAAPPSRRDSRKTAADKNQPSRDGWAGEDGVAPQRHNSADCTRTTPAANISPHALASDPARSIARQASSMTVQSKPAARASRALHATQKSVARPQT